MASSMRDDHAVSIPAIDGLDGLGALGALGAAGTGPRIADAITQSYTTRTGHLGRVLLAGEVPCDPS